MGADAASKKLLGNSIVLEYGTRTISVAANNSTYISDIVFKESYADKNIIFVPFVPQSGGNHLTYEIILNSNKSGVTSLRVSNRHTSVSWNNIIVYYFIIDIGALD